MKKKYRKVMALLLAVSMALSGCAYGGLYADEVPAASEESPADAGGMALGGTVSGGDAEIGLGGAVLDSDADTDVSVGTPATPATPDGDAFNVYASFSGGEGMVFFKAGGGYALLESTSENGMSLSTHLGEVLDASMEDGYFLAGSYGADSLVAVDMRPSFGYHIESFRAVTGEGDVLAEETDFSSSPYEYVAEITLGSDIYLDIRFAQAEVPLVDWRASTAERNLYVYDRQRETVGQEYWGETIEELISMYNDDSLEMNDDWDAFFEGTVLAGTDYGSLLWLYENGYTFDGLLEDCVRENVLNIWQYIYEISLLDGSIPTGSTVNSPGSIYGYIPSLKQGNKVSISMKEVGGDPAFCGDAGVPLKWGLYMEMTDESVPRYVREAFGWYFKQEATLENYVVAQIYIWAEGEQYPFMNGYREFKTSNKYGYSSREDFDYIPDIPDEWNYYIYCWDWARTNYNAIKSSSYGGAIKCWRNPDNPYGWQRLWSTHTFLDAVRPSGTPSGDPESGDAGGEAAYGDDVETWVKIKKLDSETGSPLEGVSFRNAAFSTFSTFSTSPEDKP